MPAHDVVDAHHMDLAVAPVLRLDDQQLWASLSLTTHQSISLEREIGRERASKQSSSGLQFIPSLVGCFHKHGEIGSAVEVVDTQSGQTIEEEMMEEDDRKENTEDLVMSKVLNTRLKGDHCG